MFLKKTKQNKTNKNKDKKKQDKTTPIGFALSVSICRGREDKHRLLYYRVAPIYIRYTFIYTTKKKTKLTNLIIVP
jgi:hypothetical protein